MMAIAYVKVGTISRGKGQSAVAAAAYRAADRLHDDRYDKTQHYESKRGVLADGILAPADAPEWMRDREQLWNAVERREDRSTRPDQAQLAREYVIALPHELNDEDREFLLKNILKEAATRKGMVADYSIHAPDKEGDNRNHHAHVLLTMRSVDPNHPDGFGAKVRAWNDKKAYYEFTEIVARETNRMLKRRGIEAEIVFELKGDDAQRHLGPAASALERQGIATEAGNHNREIEARQDERAAIQQELAQTDRQLAVLDRAERASTMKETNAARQNIIAGITEAFGKNLERGETGDRFGAYLEQEGLHLEKDRFWNLWVSDGQEAVRLDTVITDKDKRETLPYLEQPVPLALLPDRVEPGQEKPAPADRERAAHDRAMAGAWHRAERDPIQFAINLGDDGYTLATTLHGNFVAVDEKGQQHNFSTKLLREDLRDVEKLLHDEFRRNEIAVPTVAEVRQSIHEQRRAERDAAWQTKLEALHAQRMDERADRLSHNATVRDIGRAWERSDTGPAFAMALKEQEILIARVSKDEAEQSQRRAAAHRAYLGKHLPEYQEGDFVAVTKRGHVFALDQATLNTPAEVIKERLQQLDPVQRYSLDEAQDAMAFCRSIERQQQEKAVTWYDVKATARDIFHDSKNMLGRAVSLMGMAARGADVVMNIGGGVFDYFFGGLFADKHPRRVVRDDDKTIMEKTPRADLLNQPRVQELLNADRASIPLQIMEEIRRQQEQRERERGDRDR